MEIQHLVSKSILQKGTCCIPVLFVYFPAEQAMHIDAPVSSCDMYPNGQSSHASALVAPCMVEYLPGMHTVQAVAPAISIKYESVHLSTERMIFIIMHQDGTLFAFSHLRS
jgi:hypothetical protein